MSSPEQARRVLSEEGRTVVLPDGPHVLRFSMAAIDKIEAKYGTVEGAWDAINQPDGRTKVGPAADLLCFAATPEVDRGQLTPGDLYGCMDQLLEVMRVDMNATVKADVQGNGKAPFDPTPSRSPGPVSTTSPG